MKNITKTLMVCLVLAVALAMVSSTAIAQIGFGASPLWYFPAFSSQPLALPAQGLHGEILIDNFEYWDSPYNHGWIQQEPAYPVFGFGLGYATIFNTVLDLQEGSRVLDVYRPMSVFLIGTQYEQHNICHQLPVICGGGLPVCTGDSTKDVPVLSFKFRAPLGVEQFDIFKFTVIGVDSAGKQVTLTIIPTEPPNTVCSGANCCGGVPFTTDGQGNYVAQVGREYLDGSWHAVWLDLCCLTENKMAYALMVCASGQMFRLDDIIFRADYGHKTMDYPDLFEPGPLYAQIFEPYRYLFIADYAGASICAQHPHDPNNLLDIDSVMHLFLHPDLLMFEDPNEIWKTWLDDLGVDYSPSTGDPNYILLVDFDDPNDPYLNAATNLARTALGGNRPDFRVDPRLPVFTDPNLRIGGVTAKKFIGRGTLGWNSTIGGYGANGVEAFLLELLPINPYDGMPTYIPAYYDAIDAIELYGVAHFGPNLVTLVESALWNMGMRVWPNIAYMDYTPQVFEDLIVTIEVTNGAHSDVRTFPISVVNYPVENYPPVVQLDIDDQLFYVGDTTLHANEYVMVFVDPDCFIFSLAPFVTGKAPATSHVPMGIGIPIRDDQESLTYQMTLNGLTSYQYGPWMESIINAKSGLIHFTPKFEGAFDTVVTCTDNRGASGLGEITIFCVNTGTWLNHPPIILGGPTQPVTLIAGEEFILHEPNFSVEDPDGDKIYYSSNIGACGRAPDGSFMWTFQSNFPGSYMVEIVFYDIRGGYAIMEFFIDVKPWWSY